MSTWVVCGVSIGADNCATVRRAAGLADHLGARLAIVAVVPEPADRADLRDALAAGRSAVADVARRCGVADDAVHHVEVGDPLVGLTRAADWFAADHALVAA